MPPPAKTGLLFNSWAGESDRGCLRPDVSSYDAPYLDSCYLRAIKRVVVEQDGIGVINNAEQC
jgi:hypothetical protein